MKLSPTSVWLSATALLVSSGGRLAADDSVTLRLRGVPVGHAVAAVFKLTGQAYVLGGDVAARCDVELLDVPSHELERSLERAGFWLSARGPVRRVAAAAEPAPIRFSNAGDPIPFQASGVDVREFLGLIEDVTGEPILAPTGPLGTLSLFAEATPSADLLAAALAAVDLEHTRENGRLLVRRRRDAGALLLPLRAGRHYGHVPYREGERLPAARPAGIEGLRVGEVRLLGVLRRGREWSAMLESPSPFYGQTYAVGTRLYDAVLESIGSEAVVFRRDDGGAVEQRLNAAAGTGLVLAPEDSTTHIARARARLATHDFVAAENELLEALSSEGQPEALQALRAALADTHYAWAQSLLARRSFDEALRRFEAAYELDRSTRPWQAAEDLNEIGYLWTRAGEPERAVRPHQQALEWIASQDWKEPPGSGCVRHHPRSASVEGAALLGLANAERTRGLSSESRELYERARLAWRRAGDAVGQSAALTGLGLVEAAAGLYERALKRHREALTLASREPEAVAVVLNNMGSAQLAWRRYPDALKSFEDALAGYRALRDRAGEGTVLNNIGALHEARAQLPQACEAYAAALAAARESGDRGGEAATRSLLERIVNRGAAAAEALRACRAALETPRIDAR
jgi:tetratricopeptide (TPR) repeat protein